EHERAGHGLGEVGLTLHGLGDHVHHDLHPLLGGVPGRGAALGALVQSPELAGQGGGQQVHLGGEVAVEGAHGHLGLLGDRPHLDRLVPALGRQRQGGVEDPATPLALGRGGGAVVPGDRRRRGRHRRRGGVGAGLARLGHGLGLFEFFYGRRGPDVAIGMCTCHSRTCSLEHVLEWGRVGPPCPPIPPSTSRRGAIVSIATTPDQTEIQNSIKSWAKSAEPVSIVRAQETDPDAWKTLWPRLAELGLFGVAVAEEHGGAGAEIVDLACMLEEAAARMAPGPVLSTALAGVLVSRAGGAVAGALGETIAEGGLPVGVCPGFGAAPLDASGAVTGAAVAYGGTAEGAVLLPVDVDGTTRWALLEPATEGLTVTPSTPFDISAS